MDMHNLSSSELQELAVWLLGTCFAVIFSLVVFDGATAFILVVLSLSIGGGGFILTLKGTKPWLS